MLHKSGKGPQFRQLVYKPVDNVKCKGFGDKARQITEDNYEIMDHRNEREGEQANEDQGS